MAVTHEISLRVIMVITTKMIRMGLRAHARVDNNTLRLATQELIMTFCKEGQVKTDCRQAQTCL